MAFRKKQYIIVDTFAELPTANSDFEGLIAYAKDTNEVYRCTGSAWLSIADSTVVAEYIRDTIAAALTAGSNVTITPNDPSDTIEIASSGGGGGGLTLTTVEVDLGSTAKTSGRFTIAGVGLSTGKPVLINQASGPYTNKGTRTDEAEMDQVHVVGKVISSTEIECFWNSHYRVRGNFKFDYAVSA